MSMKDKVITTIAAIPKPATFKEAEKAVLRVAAYARVSTDHEEQQTSLAAQMDYYTKLIQAKPGWVFVGIYVDDGISGLGTRNRNGFNRLISDCLEGRIDLVLTKSISRFARNTVDSVSTIRMLKEKGVGVYFEKENIFTLDSKGEFLLTIMSSLAQEESRSISENISWGQRKRFADGKMSLAYGRFLGYDKGKEKYQMVVNEDQAAVVRQIFFLYIKGFSTHRIAKMLEAASIPAPGGGPNWGHSVVRSILSNEKYKGDALLQKQFTVDFLTRKLKVNEGELPQYYITEDHEAIISPWLFDYVQGITARRHNEKDEKYSGVSVFTSKITCGICGASYGPKPWHSTTYNNIVWQCRNRHRKEAKCRGPHIYNQLLMYLTHDLARKLAFKRKVINEVADLVISVVGAERTEAIRQWVAGFKYRDTWTMASDVEDLAIIIDDILVSPDRVLSITLLDGKKEKYCLPQYSPKRGVWRV